MRFSSIVLLCVLASARAVLAADFEGEITLRTIRADQARLVTMLGASATEPQKVFEVPIERFAAMKDQADSGVHVQDVVLQVRGRKVRANHIAPKDPTAYALIDTEKDSFAVVRPSDKTYFEMPTAKMEEATLAAAEKLVREQMDKLPPDKRALAEQALKQKSGAAGAVPVPTPAVKPLGKSLQLVGFQAAGYEVTSPQETTRGWVAKDTSNLGMIFTYFQQFERRMRSNPFRPQPASTVVVLSDYGMPLLAQTMNQRGYQVREVLAIKAKSLEAASMEIPAGFTKTKAAPARAK